MHNTRNQQIRRATNILTRNSKNKTTQKKQPLDPWYKSYVLNQDSIQRSKCAPLSLERVYILNQDHLISCTLPGPPEKFNHPTRNNLKSLAYCTIPETDKLEEQPAFSAGTTKKDHPKRNNPEILGISRMYLTRTQSININEHLCPWGEFIYSTRTI